MSVIPKPEPFDEKHGCYEQPRDQDDCDSSVADRLAVLLNLPVATKELPAAPKQVCAAQQIDGDEQRSGNS